MSAHLVNTTVVKHFFYNALALNALPVPLLRQVEVLERSLGALGSILELFGEHLGVILITFLG